MEQLRHAWMETGWTVAELAAKSGLGLERTTMGKKMSGVIPLKDNEIQALAKCLVITIVFPAKRQRGSTRARRDAQRRSAA